jgi:hypothetical protein
VSRSYVIDGQRLVSATTRDGRPLCQCAQVGRGGRLFAWIDCKSCRGTGGAGAPVDAVASGVRNSGSLSEGL